MDPLNSNDYSKYKGEKDLLATNNSTYEQDLEIRKLIPKTGHAFFQKFNRYTEVQRKAIPEIILGKNTLVISGTASGKTEAACAPLIEKHFSRKTPWTILYICPTRALVNDLYYRILRPAQQINLSVKRRTGDHKDSLTHLPNILITTPESFDSMLCRNRRDDKWGHDLAHVVAVVLDEIHLIHGTGRGEQVKWLIQRLKRLRNFALQEEWTKDSDIQIIGLSATIPDQQSILSEYFDQTNAAVIVCPGQREIETIAVESSDTGVRSAIPQYILTSNRNEKILVFCNSRLRVDSLARYFTTTIQKGYEIYAHHGSLSKQERETAEYAIKTKDRVIVVATSTLEIGIDIGDIDLIVLDGPPPDMPALLQRIGRGNRRTSKIRVMACSETIPDYFIQNAMIDAARDGWLGKGSFGHNYATIRQQIASYIYQSQHKKRRHTQLEELFNKSIIPPEILNSIIENMVLEHELIKDKDNILKLGEHWWKMAEDMGKIHCNIEQPHGLNIVDIDTGQKIAGGVLYRGGKGLGIAGKSLEIKKWRNMTIDVRRLVKDKHISGQWSYASSSCPVYSGPPAALKRYLEIENDIWPLIRNEADLYIFHLGGSVRKAALILLQKEYAPTTIESVKINDWYIKIPGNTTEKPQWLNDFNYNILKLLLTAEESLLNKVEYALGRPLSNKKLPYKVRVDEVWEWINIEHESTQIKNSRWEFLADHEKEDVLRHFI